MHNQPSGAAFDVVLLLHVACVVVGIVTVATAAATARRLGRLARTAAPLPETLRRYFRPGVNWAGRTIYGIPVFGFALLGMSQGAYALGDGWVLGRPGPLRRRRAARRGCPVARRAAPPARRRGGRDLLPPDPTPSDAPETRAVAADAARMERAASARLGSVGRGDRADDRPALRASAH